MRKKHTEERNVRNEENKGRTRARGQNTWMLWPVLGGDDGLSPITSPSPAAEANGTVPSAKGVSKLTPLLLCAPCKPSHRKTQSSTQWYVQQVKRTLANKLDHQMMMMMMMMMAFRCVG